MLMNIKCIEYPKADGKYYQIQHASGITIYYYPMPGKSKSAAMITTKFGSMNREFKKYKQDEWMVAPDGVAHFLEHKLFESPKGNAFDYYAKTGAKANAYTSNDRTAYYFVATDNFYESLDILLKFVKHPFFTAENVEKEKGIIGQEIRMYDDEPSWQGYISLVQSLYSVHPVRIDIAGTTETIAGITDQTLYDCYNVFYNNANLCMCIAGDLDMDKILEVCDRQLPTEESDEIRQKFPEEPNEIFKTETRKEMDVSKPQFFIGIKDNNAVNSGESFAAHELCCKILISVLFGESSAFYKELYQNGTVNAEFSADYENGVDFGFILFSGESDTPEIVRDKIAEICDNFDASMISDAVFTRIRNAMYGDMMHSLDNAESIVNRFTAAQLNGCDVFESLRAVQSVTRQDVIATATEILDSTKMAMSVIEPKRK